MLDELFSKESPAQQQEQPEGTPSYLTAIDTHQLANNNYSLAESAGYGAAGVIGSALTQTWNILPTIGNWFGGDFEMAKTKDVLQSFDDDLGKYYEQHAEGIDALGFALSSLVPGTGGIKLLKGGQAVLRGAIESEAIGAGLGKTFGLLAPKQTKYLSDAVEAALKPNAGFPIWNSNTVKAVLAGAGQSALEGAAFETAVAATMYNGPILEKQDFSDITSNIMHGALLFGGIGGVLHGATTYYKIKGAGRALDAEMVPYTHVAEANKASPTADKITTLLDDLHTTPTPTAEQFGDEAWKFTKATNLREEKVRTIQDKIRTLTGELAGGDQELAQSLYESYMKADHTNSIAKSYGTVEVSRLSEITAHERTVAKAAKNLDTEALPNQSLTYVKIAGENAGAESTTAPELVNIADSLKRSQNYSKAVTAYGEYLNKGFDAVAISPLAAEARYVTALRTSFNDSTVVGISDIPYLQAAYNKGIDSLAVRAVDGSTVQLNTLDEVYNTLVSAKTLAANALAVEGKSFAHISKVVDVAEDRLSGILKGTEESNLVRIKTGEEFSQPQWAKQVKDLSRLEGIDNFVVDAMVALKQREKQYVDAAQRASANAFEAVGLGEEEFAKLNPIAVEDTFKATRSGTGAGFFTAQNENYGSLASQTQEINKQVITFKSKAREGAREAMLPSLHAIGNSPQAAIEASVLNNRLAELPELYSYDATKGGMVPNKLKKYEDALANGERNVKVPELAEDIPDFIPIENPEVRSLFVAHIDQNSKYLDGLGSIRTNQGVKWNRDPRGYYPIPPSPRDTSHFAHVVDNSIAGAGHSKMIYAKDAAQLEEMITQIKSADPTLQVLTKKDAEAYYKSIGQYEYERTLTDLSFDSGLLRKGTGASYYVPTDPQKVIDMFQSWHEARAANVVTEAVLHANEPAVQSLQTLGEKFSAVNTSHFTKMDPLSYVQMQEKNPYADYIKSMLGMNTSTEFPFWTPINKMLDNKFSEMFDSVSSTFKQAKSVEELDSINKMMKDYGYQGAAYDATAYAHANHVAGTGALTRFIGRANSILANVMIRWDPVNALNNMVGSAVLTAPELKSVQRAIANSNSDLVGKLADLTSLSVPGTESVINSPGKLLANAVGNFKNPELRAMYRDRGFSLTHSEQANSIIDELALTGKETETELSFKLQAAFAKAKSLGDTLEKVTGNKLVEEFNRFVAADTMRQITDVAVGGGVMQAEEAWSYINTFVNRTQGNYIAAQRPGVFQGPIGQAMGLFQTYQFNLVQQLLRHVGEGSTKDMAMMMGLQSSIYGMKGLPAFDAINTHIIGNASGNQQHRDLYDSVFGAAGKNAGDWLMYGAGSNALSLISPELKFNLYSRGDINPRNVTVLPINPADVPFVQASAKLWGAVSETFGKVAQGGQVWGSMMQGIEHAGVGRPLAGLAQTLEAFGNPYGQSYSTTNKGNVVMSNDLLSVANMIRLTGAKPLDEAIGTDRAYNLSVYAAKDTELRNKLGETIKTAVIAGNQPTQEQIDNFSYEYAKAGGKQDKFAGFMMQQYKHANTSQVNEIARKVGSPASQSMQTIMGGYGLHDLSQQ